MVRIDDHEIEFCQELPISIQANKYMNLYTTMYLIVDDQQGVDCWSIKENKGKSPMVDIEGPLMVDANLFHLVNSVPL